ncbi:dihydropteroate synthase [Terrimonas sp. NA20]|uniref:dihydropteroate synthase n=1 Tax=Terrimonas ginsenosidimutans TaxID=2908004 RepID=A0ABS9KMP3_9BACT|nr:dihydropteroate synthase [Terrimonas ginsenosidimutans]MCG2613593.1 dihydropteroate synthase [Terrimonas ginsenosidimutans]
MFTLNCKGRLLKIEEPVVMGIINATPDSFFSPSRHGSVDAMLRQAEDMLNDGAVMLDIGGQSTRPGSEPVSQEEELGRTIEGIAAIHERFPQAILSIDTYYAKVAQEAVAAGASVVNDISAGSLDEAMIPAVAGLQVPYVLMHMKGTPQTMQQAPVYENISLEVLDFFIERIALLRAAGINDIILDPGFGFGKTIPHNFELLHLLRALSIPDMPLLVGLSRKGTVYKTLGITAEDALNGTTVLNTIALMNGAHILRVHDVKAAKEAITLVRATHY